MLSCLNASCGANCCCGSTHTQTEVLLKELFLSLYTLITFLSFYSHPSMHLHVPLFFHHTPPLFPLQQGTDERSKVSPVKEAAFCRSHASPSLHTHIVHHIIGEEDSAGSHYRCWPSTHKYLCMNTPAAL